VLSSLLAEMAYGHFGERAWSCVRHAS